MRLYPLFDSDYEDTKLVGVKGTGEDGWEITRADGWCFFVPSDSPIKPKSGMNARFYGAGLGQSVRGLFLDGIKVFYRTKAEQKDYTEKLLYGADVHEWLSRWDSGKSVWTIEMGGLGPSYEQCIHIVMAEILRQLIKRNYDTERWEYKEAWWQDKKEIEDIVFKIPLVKKLGISGAQWGAALSLATCFYKQGPRAIMADEKLKDRHIQVMKYFPSMEVNHATT